MSNTLTNSNFKIGTNHYQPSNISIDTGFNLSSYGTSDSTSLQSTNVIYSNKVITEAMLNQTMQEINNHLNTINCKQTTPSVEMTSYTFENMNDIIKIKDVEILVPGKVVKVTFSDGTFEKSVCHPEDKFDMEIAIGVCIAKHLCGGSGKYNKLVSKGIKVYNDKCKLEEEAKLEQERIEAKRLKNHIKRLEKRKRKEAEARNARIQEQAEAIKLAHEMINTKSNFTDIYSEPRNEV